MYFTILRTSLPPIQRFIKKQNAPGGTFGWVTQIKGLESICGYAVFISSSDATYIQKMYVKSAGKDNFLLLGDTTHVQNCVAHATQSSVDAYSGTVSDFLE